MRAFHWIHAWHLGDWGGVVRVSCVTQSHRIRLVLTRLRHMDMSVVYMRQLKSSEGLRVHGSSSIDIDEHRLGSDESSVPESLMQRQPTVLHAYHKSIRGLYPFPWPLLPTEVRILGHSWLLPSVPLMAWEQRAVHENPTCRPSSLSS